MKKFICLVITMTMIMTCLTAYAFWGESTSYDMQSTKSVGTRLATNQPTPTDINYSLERYNLIRRAYWVNGQREKANALVCQIEKPLGYIVLFAGNALLETL